MNKDEKMFDEILKVIEKYKPHSISQLREVYKRTESIDDVLRVIEIVKTLDLTMLKKKLSDMI